VVGTRTSRGDAEEQFPGMWVGHSPDGLVAVIGPAEEFRAVGGNLHLGDARREVARFRDEAWHRCDAAHSFSVIWTEAETGARFENPATGDSLALGVFEMVGIVGRMIYVEREHSRPIAFLDEAAGAWRSLIDGRLWPELVFLPIPSTSGRVDSVDGKAASSDAKDIPASE